MRLDSYQQAVVNSSAKDTLVLAGAGSGKTLTLLSKIQHLVQDKRIDPRKILVLTFTRVAADDMRNRYLAIMESKGDDVPDFNTFHGFCYQVLQNYPKVSRKLGYKEPPSIIDDIEMKRYQGNAMSLSSCKLSRKKLQKGPSVLDPIEKLQYDDYQRALKRALLQDNVIDFDTLSTQVCNLFKNGDIVAEPVKQQYRYLFVDEFQDTDQTQFEFVQSMYHCDRTLFGDALQNIYQFRGCSNKPMLKLMKDDHWDKKQLPVNYRSTKQICDYVNSLSSNFSKDTKENRIELISDREGPEVQGIEKRHSDFFTYRDIEEIKDIIESNNLQGKTAILCRTNKEVQEICEHLKRFIKVSDNQSTEYELNLLKAVDDTEFCTDWLESQLSERDYINYTRLENLKEIKKNPKWLIQTLGSYNSVRDIVDDYYVLDSVLNVTPLTTMTFQVCEMFGVDEPDRTFEAKSSAIAYLLNRVAEKEREDVYVGTIHSVKGLEFDNVIVYGVNSGSFQIHNEETENLLYVACTRAKDNLFVITEEGKKVGEVHNRKR